MARLRFPDAASVDRVQATSGLALLSASGATAIVYLDDAGVQLADDLLDAGGNPVTDGTFLLDDLSRLPEFDGPTSGVEQLWVRVDGGAPLMIEATLTSRIAAMRQSIDDELTDRGEMYPLARDLPDSYVANTTDLGPYIAAALANLELSGRGGLLLPPGTHLLNSQTFLAAATRDLTYHLKGHGRGTTIRLGAAITNLPAITVNETSLGALGVQFPRHPRLRFTDMTVTADPASAAPWLIHSREASVSTERIRFVGLKWAITVSGYTDTMRFEGPIGWESAVEGGAMYEPSGLGDAFTMTQVTAHVNSVVARLTGTAGGTIKDCIGGRYYFTNCNSITISQHHLDAKVDGANSLQNPAFVISGSRVHFVDCWDHVGPNSSIYEINDTAQSKASDVTFERSYFGFRIIDPERLGLPHIKLTQMQPESIVRFRSCSAITWRQGVTTRYRAGASLITASEAAVQAGLATDHAGVLKDVDFRYQDTVWQFQGPSPMVAKAFSVLGVPLLTPVESANITGVQAVGTYYYTAASYLDGARSLHTQASAEASVTVSALGNGVQVGIASKQFPTHVRLWRGTSPGVYDRYVDLVIDARAEQVFDVGDSCTGVAWTTSAVPTPPSGNTTMDGLVTGTRAQMWGSAAPTEGTWTRGDLVYRTTPSGGGKAGWICTTAGTPGTWKLFGSIDA